MKLREDILVVLRLEAVVAVEARELLGVVVTEAPGTEKAILSNPIEIDSSLP